MTLVGVDGEETAGDPRPPKSARSVVVVGVDGGDGAVDPKNSKSSPSWGWYTRGGARRR